jgi:hypothetical protein
MRRNKVNYEDCKVVKPFGKFKKGDLLRAKNRDHLRIIKRKIQEDVESDPTIIPVGKKKTESKMVESKYENKMVEKSEENKKGGK